jgi:hypothetical protein
MKQFIFTSVYLTFKFTLWGVGCFWRYLATTPEGAEPEVEVEDPQPILDELSIIAKTDELEALEGLIQTLKVQEQALLDEALRNKIKKPAKAAKLEAQAARVHLQMIQRSNKAVRLREELDL